MKKILVGTLVAAGLVFGLGACSSTPTDNTVTACQDALNEADRIIMWTNEAIAVYLEGMDTGDYDRAITRLSQLSDNVDNSNYAELKEACHND